MTTNVPTYQAVVSFPPGLDETRLAVFDEHGQRAAETTWRPSDNYQPGPAAWDYQLHRLGFARRSPWQPTGLGFGADVERIIRSPKGGIS